MSKQSKALKIEKKAVKKAAKVEKKTAKQAYKAEKKTARIQRKADRKELRIEKKAAKKGGKNAPVGGAATIDTQYDPIRARSEAERLANRMRRQSAKKINTGTSVGRDQFIIKKAVY